ncbi:hypothetical protein O6H91_04G111400 [Diphasiastrum complanatum]|uniref:Uncharacterized protein n=2 Tax=Diphasiastrum complanatum TaxID=34168 RepID=A0ACC2E0A6_DIPCM|nr:hypothetical protein O6H91_04G111400 [Diphasiastrum complanatum]
MWEDELLLAPPPSPTFLSLLSLLTSHFCSMNLHVSAVALGATAAAHPCPQFCFSSFAVSASASASACCSDQSSGQFAAYPSYGASAMGAGYWVGLSHHRAQLVCGFESPMKHRVCYTETVLLGSQKDFSESVPQLQQKPVLISKQTSEKSKPSEHLRPGHAFKENSHLHCSRKELLSLSDDSNSKSQQPALLSQAIPDLSWMSADHSSATGATDSDVQTTWAQEHLRESSLGAQSSTGSVQARFFAKLEAERRFEVSSQRTSQANMEDNFLSSTVQTSLANVSSALDEIPKSLDHVYHPSAECDPLSEEPSDALSTETEAGKIFVGNLPYFAKKESITDFFRQFGPLSNVILIKNNENLDRNKGYCFILFGGSDPAASALKATEFNGVEFYGKPLTVRLDDGRRLKGLKEERNRWIDGSDDRTIRSEWHEEREKNSLEFLRVLENFPQDWQRVIQAFHRIEKPRQRDFALLVGYFAKRGDKHNARSAFESMRSVGIQPNIHIYTNLVHAYAMAKDMRGAVACIEDMQAECISPNQATYSVIVSGYGRMGQNEVAETWFQKLKLSNLPLNTIIFNNIISAHCKAGNMRRVEALVLEMEEAGFEATLGLYNCIMDGYANACEEKNCLMIFHRLKEAGMHPNVVSYGCLINLYCKLGKIGKAIKISKEMQAHGIPHNKKTYSMLIDGFVQLEDSANAFSVFEDMMKEGLKPDIVTYNILVNAFCKTRHMDRAFGLLNRMKKEGQRPTFQTYTTIIDGFIRAKDIKMALEMVHQMKKAGCKPSTATYNVMMYGLVQEGQMDRAVAIIDEMVLAGITPNERSYTILMEGYACIGELGTAFKFFKKMKEEGLKADIVSYGALLKACCKAGRMQSALAVLQEMNSAGVGRNLFIYNILLDGWAQRGDMWEAAEVLHQMRKEGHCPDIYTYTSFINACCKAGDMQKAMETVADMKRTGVEPNIKTYTTLVHGWASASYPEKALACYHEMKEAGLKPDKAIYHCLMTSLLSRAAVARETVHAGIKSIVSEMIDQGLSVDLATATHFQRYLYKAEGSSGELTELVQRIYPPDWAATVETRHSGSSDD